MPGRRDQSHTRLPFDGLQDINGAAVGPPAITCGFQEATVVQPFFLSEGRCIASESTTSCFKTQQRKPILEPRDADVASIPGRVGQGVTGQTAPYPPKTEGIEARHHYLPLGHQYPLHFPQHMMRIVGEFKHMGQNHEIHALAGKGQMSGNSADIHQPRFITMKAEGHTVAPQKIVPGQSDLNGVEAKYIGQQQFMLVQRPLEYIVPLGCFQPVLEVH